MLNVVQCFGNCVIMCDNYCNGVGGQGHIESNGVDSI